MQRILSWIGRNKLSTVLLLILAFFIAKSLFGISSRVSNYPSDTTYSGISASSPLSMGKIGLGAPAIGGMIPNIIPQRELAPSDSTNRLVIQNSSLSLQVKDVREAADQIISYARQAGGFMVNSYFNNPGEGPSASVTVRVPNTQLNSTLKYFRDLSIKVVSENLQGEDVTDQYVDNQAKLDTLNKTKAKFEQILDKATEISDILNIEQQLISLQSQIDGVKGQQQYLEKSAELTSITIYLSTDEFSLPYAPSDSWRADVIFKQAVRAAVGTLRQIGTVVIWVAVYAIFWIPALIVILLLRKKFSSRSTS
ncbi:hypothetical protein A3D77_00085 [Candidatus Gottesmanbacteria bacterium RIFCSPHIGHO2_02_FULL_39_11]|uniref:DUF4349 domain-containing protein n=1 Tax=Candidatus Gottesmanbacteria bacterium RIFCSPHIGHO2_02_FULL_39_11 TaxID=1798382 RepID=A0A1F5ZWH3_9BACT|nr:MAG: hypothetical protein A3D77_00085 [Candidatus Gottesmanbacteria bacterium RIFCSPHIGHO2_02_FULL_39_11]